MRFLTPLLVLLTASCVRAQSDYTLYLTGSETDVVTAPRGGVCMMGGRTENDEAMRWFLNRADGGDVVVLRASGSDGYNDYFYEQLGVTVNSVRTFVFDSGADAGAMEVIEAVANAEAVWFAGGDQAKYVDYWRGTPLDSTLGVVINERNAVVGGTSAGMAILGGYYFSAANGTITSDEALNDPFDERMTIENQRFIRTPRLYNFITDTHFSERGREGRLLAFMARSMFSLHEYHMRAIACDEFTAVCIDEAGLARVFGDPDEEDYAFFIESPCIDSPMEIPVWPSQFTPGAPLTWNELTYGGVYANRIRGTANGSGTYDLVAYGGNSSSESWYHWTVTDGQFNSTPLDIAPSCVSSVSDLYNASAQIAPNPAVGSVHITTDWPVSTAQIVDVNGRILKTVTPANNLNFTLPTSTLSPGSYYLLLSGDGKRARQRFVVP